MSRKKINGNNNPRAKTSAVMPAPAKAPVPDRVAPPPPPVSPPPKASGVHFFARLYDALGNLVG